MTRCRTQTAEAVHAWLSRHLPDGPRPSINRPFNYVKAAIVTTSVLGVISFVTVAAPYIWPVLQNRNLWAAFSLIAVLLFTSGQMFNHIRKTPYAGGDGKGGLSIFAGGFQSQFGLETQVVAGLCESLVHSMIEKRANGCVYRWYPSLCNNHTRSQGSQNSRRANTTNRCTLMGSCRLLGLQLPAEHLQIQERWLPILPATFLRRLRTLRALVYTLGLRRRFDP